MSMTLHQIASMRPSGIPAGKPNPTGGQQRVFGMPDVKAIGWVEVDFGAGGYLFFCTDKGMQGEVYGDVADAMLKELSDAHPKDAMTLMEGLGNYMGGDCSADAWQAVCKWRSPEARASRVGEVLRGSEPVELVSPYVVSILGRPAESKSYETLHEAIQAYLGVENGRWPKVSSGSNTLLEGDPEMGGGVPLFASAVVQRAYFDVCESAAAVEADEHLNDDDGCPAP